MSYEKKRKRIASKDSGSISWYVDMKKKLAPLRRALPVYQHRTEICNAVKENETVLVVADTGSGKSTQLPAYLLETGFASPWRGSTDEYNSSWAGVIAVTQPRRIAAMTLASRVSQELGCIPGTIVGHKVRFDSCFDLQGERTTSIIYITDGMLLKEATSDPLLRKYGVIVLDEAHERSLQTDVLFGVVKRAMEARRRDKLIQHTQSTDIKESKDSVTRRKLRVLSQRLRLSPLKAVVMSATLDVESFQSFFSEAQTLYIQGRSFPVQTVYTNGPQDDYVESALSAALQIHRDTEDGDILIFLPGQEDIHDLASLLRKNLTADGDSGNKRNGDSVQKIDGNGTSLDAGNGSFIVNRVLVCVLYAALPPEAQLVAFQPKPDRCERKMVLATNIAETSVTVNGIRYVIDCGKFKSRRFTDATGMESLTLENVSRDQATQRCGRAGRESSGLCFRLYTEDTYRSLAQSSMPEIQRVNLAQVVLQLKTMGVDDPRNFDFVTPPNSSAVQKAFELLYALGAVDQQMELTRHGKQLAILPLNPTFGHLMLQSPAYGCVSEMLTAVAMLSSENIFHRPGGSREGSIVARGSAAHRRFVSHEGDLPTLLNVYQFWHREAAYRQKSRWTMKDTHSGKLDHFDWCHRNFISSRSLLRAHEVRLQLEEICGRPKPGLGLDVSSSCGGEIERFLKCACSGLFLQVACLNRASVEVNTEGKSNPTRLTSMRGKYVTKVGNRVVSIHPTSSMFGRQPAPKCVLFTELLSTKKAYIRGVTQIREEWLSEVVPAFYTSPNKSRS